MGGALEHHSGALKTQGLSHGERGADNCLVRRAACTSAEMAAAGTLADELPKRMRFSKERLREIAEALPLSGRQGV